MQLLKKEREREGGRGGGFSLDLGVCMHVCMYVCVRDTRPDRCQHVELIRLVITAWKRDGENEGKQGEMRERKQVEDAEI